MPTLKNEETKELKISNLLEHVGRYVYALETGAVHQRKAYLAFFVLSQGKPKGQKLIDVNTTPTGTALQKMCVVLYTSKIRVIDY